VRLKTVRKLPV